MIKVSVLKSDGSQGWGGQFQDQNSANAWISQGTAAGWWGIPAQAAVSAVSASYSGVPAGATTSITLTAQEPGSAGNISFSFDGTSSLSSLVSNWNSANPVNQVTLSGDGTQIPSLGSVKLSGGSDAIAAVPGYTIVQTDVTAQYNLQQATNKALSNQSVGATVVATVAAINESKLAAGTMSQQTFSALLADQNVLNIERLLWNGSLVTAKALIQSANLSAYYTSDEVASIIALLPS